MRLRPISCCDNLLSNSAVIMSSSQDNRAERMALYKEERRKQLAAQFGTTQSDPSVSRRKASRDVNSSSSEGGSSTRVTRITTARSTRTTANAQEDGSSPSQVAKSASIREASTTTTTTATITTKSFSYCETAATGSTKRIERDKSSKRKSNLNRALNSEEVPNLEYGDNVKARRQRRRFFPPEVLGQNTSCSDKIKSDTNLTASPSAQSSNTSPITASSASTTITHMPSRKSELRIHMENARKGVVPSYSEMGRGKFRRPSKDTSSSKSDLDNSHSDKDSSRAGSSREITKKKSSFDNSKNNKSSPVRFGRNTADLTALTKETLATVDRLTSSTVVKNKKLNGQEPYSILKRRMKEVKVEAAPAAAPTPALVSAPVSILKRKVSQDERLEGGSTHTPPVTFSPSVIEPAITNRKQGILKKRRSLDESQVLRHRSCSPDVANNARSILKTQRRSSLEELTRTESPEPHLHGILKRKTSRAEDEDLSLNSPQSILKRRSGASSAGSSGSTPHVSITTAVILAAAGGAEMVLEPPAETVRPILKKKSFSEEQHSSSENFYYCDALKPILKKKSSTDTEEYDERPKRPILKVLKNSTDRESFDSAGSESRSFAEAQENDGVDIRPILKAQREERPRLSFCDDSSIGDEMERRSSFSSRSINTEINGFSNLDTVEAENRPLSVSQLVLSFENSPSTGAIPKQNNTRRTIDRRRTQPVTSNELEASLNFVRGPSEEDLPRFAKPRAASPDDVTNYTTAQSLLHFMTSLEKESNLNSFLSSSLVNSSRDSGVCGKMSSDSAFQSLGDGLELEQEDNELSDTSSSKSSNIETQMKAVAEEAKKMLRNKDRSKFHEDLNSKLSKRLEGSPRFFTRSPTPDRKQETKQSKVDSGNIEDDGEFDPINLSLSERIKLFSSKMHENNSPKFLDGSRRRFNRFQTQPVTSAEFKTARCIPSPHALEKQSLRDKDSKKGILKGNLTFSRSPPPIDISSHFDGSSKAEKLDTTYDEGISCNDSASDSEIASSVSFSKNKETKSKFDVSGSAAGQRYSSKFDKYKRNSSGDTASDGDSSGGREVRSIFKNDNRLKVKLALENVLSKSKSQSIITRNEKKEPPEEDSCEAGSIRRSQTQAEMPRSIVELQAKLQESGESGWKKRLNQNNSPNQELKLLKDKNKYNDEISEKSILASKKDELDAASHHWKSRVEKSDAEKFSVAGRMEKFKDGSHLPINIPAVDKRTPRAKRFKGKESSDSSSTPCSPEKSVKRPDWMRSHSVADPEQYSCAPTAGTPVVVEGRKVVVSKPDDFTFTSFYKSVEYSKKEVIDISSNDLDAVTRQSLLVQKKGIQVQKRRGASRNPVKALASRTDILNEYTEVLTGVAEREKKRHNIEKLTKHSNLAVEALAGLASKEDFTSVALKKSSLPKILVPFKDIMLLQVKGRRHVQTRLIETAAASINEGDCFILVTSKALYNYTGAYSNVIEQSRAADIVNHIQHTGDLGCKVAEVINIDSSCVSSESQQVKNFWKILGSPDASEKFTCAGNPGEDGLYESNILATNMIYGLEKDELVPLDEYWGSLPKIEMLQPTKVFVFDFGSEMYVWSGKNAPIADKKRAFALAKELWEEGYNYSDCNVCPLNVASILGDRCVEKPPLKSSARPDWALFSKITQHRETILFKEKFLDWPDFSKVKPKPDQNEKFTDPSYDIKPCNAAAMLKENEYTPDLVVEGNHLGRGCQYFDEETKRLFEFDTTSITTWRVLENNLEKLCDKSFGHFYESDSFVIRWNYKMTVKGRELSGKPSKHLQSGKNKCIYFYWQGDGSSVNEKGCAALLAVELDMEKAPQIRVVQSLEPAAFLRLFKGSMVVHKGKKDQRNADEPHLYLMKGELQEEVCLVEVGCEMKELRSRTSFVLLDPERSEVTVWHGSKSSDRRKKICRRVADRMIKERSEELGLGDDTEVIEMEEGEESRRFFNLVGKDRNSYFSLKHNDLKYEHEIRLFHFTSISGTLEAVELQCPYRSEHPCSYPFVQSELYSASQPALFLIDNYHELWLWQGWWPEREEEVLDELSDQTGSGAVRWQEERKAAMQTTVNYWRERHPNSDGDKSVGAYLVWAGFEPTEFKNLFPSWIEREDISELNSKYARESETKLLVEKELTRLSRSTYPLSELLHRPLPDGVDPTRLEIYLSPEDFEALLSVTKEEFQKLPIWKQTAMKKEKGLF